MIVKYTPDSRADIESIYVHIATNGGPASGDRIVEAIVSTCEDLGLFPALGRRRPELDDLGLEIRSIGERGYVIFYTEFDEDVHVIRVLHGSRDLAPEFLDSIVQIVN